MLILRAPGQALALPLGPFVEAGQQLMNQLYDLELATFAGHRLADIPGLEFSRIQSQRADDAALRLTRGVPAAFDARALIAGATEASLDHPERVERIRTALRASIVGVGTDERMVHVRELAGRPSTFDEVAGDTAATRDPRRFRVRPLTAPRIIESLLVGEILDGGRRHPMIASRS
jgi:hypothetical protein